LMSVDDPELRTYLHYCSALAKLNLADLGDEGPHLDQAVEHLWIVYGAGPTNEIRVLLAESSRALAFDDHAGGQGVQLALAATLPGEVRAEPHTDEEGVTARTLLGLVLADRYDVADDLADLTDAIRLLTDVEPLFSPADPGRPEVVATLGRLHLRAQFAPQA